MIRLFRTILTTVVVAATASMIFHACTSPCEHAIMVGSSVCVFDVCAMSHVEGTDLDIVGFRFTSETGCREIDEQQD